MFKTALEMNAFFELKNQIPNDSLAMNKTAFVFRNFKLRYLTFIKGVNVVRA